MRERPILFSGEMVRAILEGRKTQTRRVVKKWHGAEGLNLSFSGLSASQVSPGFWRLSSQDGNGAWNERCGAICPYGKPGDRLWVRETSFIWGRWVKNGFSANRRQKWRFKIETPHTVIFDPKHPQVATKSTPRETCMYWRRPSIHMPRWASRITLEIIDIRVQRLQNISEEDAIAEGAEKLAEFPCITPYRNYQVKQPAGARNFSTARASFASLWMLINGADSYNANPWVWALTFKRVTEVRRG